MTREEAKAILQMSPPGGPNRDDPEFAEALQWLQDDPELAEWFARQQAFDGMVSAQLKGVPVPAGLEANLQKLWATSGRPAAEAAPSWKDRLMDLLNTPILRGGSLIKPAWWRNWQARVALALGLVVLAIGAGAWYLETSDTFSNYRQAIVDASWQQSPHLDLANNDLTQIKEWLTQHRAPSDFPMPPALLGAKVQGCSVLEWRGRPVAFLCFLSDSGHFHLLVSGQEDYPDAPMPDTPVLARCKGWSTASWTTGANSYVLTGMKTQTFVRKFRKDRQWSFGG